MPKKIAFQIFLSLLDTRVFQEMFNYKKGRNNLRVIGTWRYKMDFMLSYDLQDIKTFSAAVIVIFPFSNCDNTISEQDRKEQCLTFDKMMNKKKKTTEFQ